MLVDPSPKLCEAYDLLLETEQLLLDRLVPGSHLEDVYQAACEHVEQKNAALAQKMTRSLGFVTGIEFREGTLQIAPKMPQQVVAGANFSSASYIHYTTNTIYTILVHVLYTSEIFYSTFFKLQCALWVRDLVFCMWHSAHCSYIYGAGMVFNVSIGFSGLVNEKDANAGREHALFLGDLVLVNAEGPATALTSVKKRLKDIKLEIQVPHRHLELYNILYSITMLSFAPG